MKQFINDIIVVLFYPYFIYREKQAKKYWEEIEESYE